MKYYPYRFRVKAYMEEGNDDGTGLIYRSSGFGVCTGYGDAATQLEKAHDIIAIEYLTLFEEGTIIELPEEVCVDYEKRDFPDLDYMVEVGD